VSTPYSEALGSTLIDRTIREKIVLVGVTLPGSTDDDTEASLDELEQLVDTAGADVVGRIVQRRDAPDHTWFIGKGKAEELRVLCLAVDADTVVFDNELHPAQQFNLEKLLGRTAIDRTAVILDIFAQNAHTLEGRAQVELALLRYRLPRLRRGSGAKLSQQRGGVGARFGGGETKIEVDRRRIDRRIRSLEAELRALAETRGLQRKRRSRSGLAEVTIVGYTNAGKSTLLNRLTSAGVLAEDRLFATLDPTTRRLSLPGGEPVLLTDTVGFVRRLPHGLVEAFKGTLEVAATADLLVHVVDASAPDPEGQIAAVREVLAEIDADRVPEFLVINKADVDPVAAADVVAAHPGSVAISAATGDGIDVMLATLGDRLRSLSTVTELFVPWGRGDVIASVHREGQVVSSREDADGMRIRARLSDESVGRLAEWVVEPTWNSDGRDDEDGGDDRD
jgi:GTP-binding protein HflX